MSEEAKPLVTFALFAYNQEKYIREAVEGALAQDYPNLEIILSDDCSTDRTFEIMREMVAGYEGPHKVLLNKNLENQGICGHVNDMFDRASGELVVMAAGDDVSYPTRTSKLVAAWIRNGMSSAVLHSDSRIVEGFTATKSTATPSITDSSALTVNSYVIGGMNLPIRGQSASYTRSLFTAFGPLDKNGSIEDGPLVFRALLLGAPIIYVKETLLDYRVTGGNVCMGYSRSDRDRTIRWMRARKLSITQQVTDYGLNNDDRTINTLMQKQVRRFQRCEWLASSNPIKLAIGMAAYTEGRPILARIRMLLRYFDLVDSWLHITLRKFKRLFYPSVAQVNSDQE